MQMKRKLPSELQRVPVQGVILFFEGHVFKALRNNSLMPSCVQHMFLIWNAVGGYRILKKSVGDFLGGQEMDWIFNTTKSFYYVLKISAKTSDSSTLVFVLINMG